MGSMSPIRGCRRTIMMSSVLLFFVGGMSATDGAPPTWTFVTGGRIVGSPVVTETGRVYAVAEDRYLYAVEHGVARWRYDLRVRPIGPIRVSPDGTVVVRTRADSLVAVNPGGGTVWAYRHRTEIASFEHGGDGHVLIGDSAGVITALSATGRVVFRVAVGDSPVTTILRGSGYNLFAATRDGRLAAITDGGARVFRRLFEARIEAMASTADRVIIALSDGRLIAVDTFGREVWTIGVPEAARRLGVAGAHIALISDNAVWFFDNSGITVGDDRFDGLGDTVIAGDGVFVAAGNAVYSVRASQPRAPVARFSSGVGAIGAGGGRVAIGTDDWVLSSFGNAHATSRPGIGARVPYWRTSYDYLFLKDQISAGTDQAVRATREMISRVDRADLAGSYHTIRELLIEVATPRTPRTGRVIPPDVRSAAVRALGRLGDAVVRDFLARAVAAETDPLVMVAIFDAFTDTGIVSPEPILEIAARYLSRARGAELSGEIARAGVDLVIAAHRYAGYVPDVGVELLRRAMEAPFPREIREYALTAARQIDGR
ncbi:MAG: hypothetical protein EA426_16115 [Spirochaetaceae bacterium]|nr:MAG: hypothetical protein EA426_16115 [Spirochaetaceae bacterium]